jgi:homoserine O-acetyltransferase
MFAPGALARALGLHHLRAGARRAAAAAQAAAFSSPSAHRRSAVAAGDLDDAPPPPPPPPSAHAACSAAPPPPHDARRPRALAAFQRVTLQAPLLPHLGGVALAAGDVCVDVECHGDPSLPAERTVVVMPSFSHSAHVASNRDDPSPGWWQQVVGPGRAINTNHFRVLCLSVLGSHYSPTNPAAPRRVAGAAGDGGPPAGRAWRAAFPQLTPTDLARCHRLALDALGVTRPLHAVVGASLGGMQALQFASLFPGDVRRLVAVACTGRTTPFTVALRRMQRRAILADPHFRGGDYADDAAGRGPWEGLKQARELGTIFYRSREEFDARFAWAAGGEGAGASPAASAPQAPDMATSIGADGGGGSHSGQGGRGHGHSTGRAARGHHTADIGNGAGAGGGHGPSSQGVGHGAGRLGPFTSLDSWEVESYLAYSGRKFAARRYDPNAYLLLSRAMDLMDLGDGAAPGRGNGADAGAGPGPGAKEPPAAPRRSYAEGAALIASRGCRSLLVGVSQDALIPAQELSVLADTINAAAQAQAEAQVEAQTAPSASAAHPAGGPAARFVALDSPYGHDAFLLEPEALGALIRSHLEEGLERDLAGEALHSTGVNSP